MCAAIRFIVTSTSPPLRFLSLFIYTDPILYKNIYHACCDALLVTSTSPCAWSLSLYTYTDPILYIDIYHVCGDTLRSN